MLTGRKAFALPRRCCCCCLKAATTHSLPNDDDDDDIVHIGVNIGTTNTYVSVLDEANNKKPKVIEKFPSVVHLKSDSHPISTIYGFKRLLGKSFYDPLIQMEMKRGLDFGVPSPYKIVMSPDGCNAWIETSYGHVCSPEQMLQVFLAKRKETAESYFGSDSVVSRAVFTFPLILSSIEVNSVCDTAGKAGLLRGNFINEPIAAAISYGMHNKEDVRLFAVVDLGGRTLDVCVLERTPTPGFRLRRGPVSNMFLGGEDFDNVLMEYLVSEAASGLTIKDIPFSTAQRLRRVAEQAKIQLSSISKVEIDLSSIFPSNASGCAEKNRNITLTRSKFENLVRNLIEKIKYLCHMGLKEAGVIAKDVDEVLLVGGMARVPIVERVITEIFGKSPCRGGVDPAEAVALGAAAAIVQKKWLGLYIEAKDVENLLGCS